MKRHLVLLALLFLCTVVARAQQPFKTVVSRYKDFLIAQDQTSQDSLTKWVKTIKTTGDWPDVDYEDQNPTSWKVRVHLDRVIKISIAYHHKGSRFYHNKYTWQKITLATAYWFDKNYKNSNWWQNEIGVPQNWRDIISLNSENFTKDQLSKALAILGQYNLRANFTGANLTWSADLALHYGLFTADATLVKKASDLLINEVKMSNGEGIRQDFSYHQHGSRLQTHHYGSSFLTENIRLAYELQQTPWQFPVSKLAILKNYLLNGWQWMARGIYITPATVDRAISRQGVLVSDITKILPYLIKMYPANEGNELTMMLNVQQGKTQTLNGFKYFPISDFGAYQNQAFSFFVKTISSRTEVTEHINGENQKGSFLNLGNTYLIKSGQEYLDLMPLWDWKYLPGTTNFRNAKAINRLDFVGGVTAGTNGLSVMDFETNSDSAKLTGSKFWAIHHKQIFCLIGDLSLSGSKDTIYTSLEQARLQGKVLINGPQNILSQNTLVDKDVKWVNHNGFSYIALSGCSLSVSNENRTGSWREISKSGTSQLTTAAVFSVNAKHQNQTAAAYLIDGFTQPSQLDVMLAKPNWQILKNDKNCQAIAFNDGETFISFHRNDELTYQQNSIKVDRSCLLIVSRTAIYASDPLQKGGELTVVLNGKKIMLLLPKDGATIKKNL